MCALQQGAAQQALQGCVAAHQQALQALLRRTTSDAAAASVCAQLLQTLAVWHVWIPQGLEALPDAGLKDGSATVVSVCFDEHS